MKDKRAKGKIGIVLIVVAVVLVLLALYLMSSYNNFVKLNQDVDGKWGEVENQYQRQADLIPNLVSTVSSAVKVETKFVSDVTQFRTNWANSKSIAEKDSNGVQMNNGVTAFVNAVAENYPTLQANKQYVALTDELSGTQNRITVARGRYIESIQKFNTAVKSFPGNVVAGIFGFSEKDYYKAELFSMKTPSLGNGTLP
jgi:LemA protein